jgi:hypothetical protein
MTYTTKGTCSTRCTVAPRHKRPLRRCGCGPRWAMSQASGVLHSSTNRSAMMTHATGERAFPSAPFPRDIPASGWFVLCCQKTAASPPICALDGQFSPVCRTLSTQPNTHPSVCKGTRREKPVRWRLGLLDDQDGATPRGTRAHCGYASTPKREMPAVWTVPEKR